MAEQKFLIDNMALALQQVAFPSITLWNRLEGRPRTHHFDRALRCEVRDALWMLARQWQMGELKGDDAGSPVFARLHVTSTRLTKYQPAQGAVRAFDEAMPLETKVEQLSVPFAVAGQAIALDIRLLLGRQWLKMLGKVGLGAYTDGFKAAFDVKLPDAGQRSGAAVCAHLESWRQFAACAGRKMDGYQWLRYLRENPAPRTFADLAPGLTIDPGDAPAIDTLGDRFQAWFERLFAQPSTPEERAWLPERLEYQFQCSAPEGEAEKVFLADEYHHGRLDWYNLDLDPQKTALDDAPSDPAPSVREARTLTFVPAPLEFDGMPNTRWWAFEEGRTNFGDVKPDTTDLGKLLLIEFGLIYANDWFLLPLTLPAGTVARVEGLAVTNVFGERTWVEAAGRGAAANWQRWSMFTLDYRENTRRRQADTSLLLLPTVPKIQEGKPLEQVMLIRDEMANMVWGIETVAPLPHGLGKPGGEAALETRQFFQRLLDKQLQEGTLTEETLPFVAPIRYQAMSTVPENWIPFIPVRVPGSNRQVQLQRASMPRMLDGDPEKPRKVKPRATLLREGLDIAPAIPYFLHEEETPRAGAKVSLAFQRTRWYGGKVFTWLGAHKQTGRGEGASGLRFDWLKLVKAE
jgi:hypothetical protein